MFVIDMPKSFKVGDTAPCKVDGELKQVMWRDLDTLVIEPNDFRRILQITSYGTMRYFVIYDIDEE